jgi:hypothetical protein
VERSRKEIALNKREEAGDDAAWVLYLMALQMT